MSKQLINLKEDWASEGIKGYLYANNQDLLALKDFPNVVIRRDHATLAQNNQVAILAGGGSGHEPAHLGFIGAGMLTGVVCGHLFASPSTAAILAAIRFVGGTNKAGVLLIVKNYTGDRLNFGLAAKRAQMEGINVDWILVDDDVALLESKNAVVGSRGLCGTVVVEKLAGALAEQGKSLKEVKERLEEVLKGERLRTLGVSLSGRVILPGESVSIKSDDSNLIEVGLGIHGETGRKKMPLPKSAALAELALDEYVLRSIDYPSKDICLMINNLGGLSNLEIYLYANDCVKHLQKNRPDLKLRRLYVGTFMTSLNMNGFSVTSFYLDQDKADVYLDLLDAPTDAPAWSRSCGKDIELFEYSKVDEKAASFDLASIDLKNYIHFETGQADLLKATLQTISQELIDLKDFLNKLDSGCGDGDCGDSMSTVSQVILNEIETGKLSGYEYPHRVFMHLSVILENGGGSLCILLALFISAAAKAFVVEEDEASPSDQIGWFKVWFKFMELGISAVEEYGRAKPGQRSIVDPLTTIKECLGDYIKSVEDAVVNQVKTNILLKLIDDKTLISAESTSKMVPVVGRASYVDASGISSPDPGAMAMSSAFNSVYKRYLKSISE